MKDFLAGQKNHKDLVEFSFSEKELSRLQWEDANEFRYNGKMYDVIEKKKEGQKIVICCISDEKETALLEEYQKKQGHDHTTASILQLMTTAFLFSSYNAMEPPQKEIAKIVSYYQAKTCTQPSSLFIPPPNVCLYSRTI